MRYWLAAIAVTPAGAQTFPSKTVHLVVPYAAGGTGDIVVRVVSDKLAAALGQSGFDIMLWQGFLARGTPPEVVKRLNAEFNRILAQPDAKAELLDAGADTMPMAVDQVLAFVKAGGEKFLQIIKDSNLKPQ